MKLNLPNLFIEISNNEYTFIVVVNDENNNLSILYKNSVSIKKTNDKNFFDFELAHNTIKKNIYLIEQKLNFILKETIVILNNFNTSFVNLVGYKKLNGSQVLKENITYLLNSLKSNVDEFETEKQILHIFNSKYCLDKKKIENLPIGLFGDFYSHELSFCLINKNDYKNFNNIFNKCNLKLTKILLKSFVEGSYLSNKYKNSDTFLKVKIGKNYSQIFYFENDALKSEQNFSFGSNLVQNDISKVTSLNKDIVKKILYNFKFSQKISEQELIEEKLFKDEKYRKIKKKLIYEIATARIQELSEIFLIKNINFSHYLRKDVSIFLEINDKTNLKCFEESYRLFFSKKAYLKLKFIENITIEETVNSAYNLIHFGWRREAVPVIQSKKSLISRFFDIIFE